MDRNITFDQIISEGSAKSEGLELLIEKKRAERAFMVISEEVFLILRSLTI